MAGMRKTPHTSKPHTNKSNTTEATPRDFRQEVTDQIIALLEKGVAPWQKPWDASRSGLMPINQVTQKPYRGGNVLHLMITALDKSYDDPRWMTYCLVRLISWFCPGMLWHEQTPERFFD